MKFTIKVLVCMPNGEVCYMLAAVRSEDSCFVALEGDSSTERNEKFLFTKVNMVANL